MQYLLLETVGPVMCLTILTLIRVATGQGKVREIQGQGNVREFYNLSGKFGIFLKVREIQDESGKFMKIYIS